MFKAPAAVENQDLGISAELKAEAKSVQDILFSAQYSDDEANAIIAAFNEKWISAGGSAGSTIMNRSKVESWKVR